MYVAPGLLLSGNSAAREAAGIGAGKREDSQSLAPLLAHFFLVHIFRLATLWQCIISFPCLFPGVFQSRKNKEPSFICTS